METGDAASPPLVLSFPRAPVQVAFDRGELQRILDVYGRMVAAGEWRDYAMDLARRRRVSVPLSARLSGPRSA
jgi:hypothetical protein